MLVFNKLIIKNFMSFGNVEEVINLNDPNLILIIGENRDVTVNGSYTDSRNGVGKTAIQNAITYAIYDRTIGKIKKDNLVNKFNEKNMVVTLEFTKDNIKYKVIRGRKPNILKFYIDGKEFIEDVAQGENRETQPEIEKVIGCSFDLFKQIIALSTSGEPFLSLGEKNQREVIEALLCITQLSEKAEKLKKLAKDTADEIKIESARIKTIETLNEKTLGQISKLEADSRIWQSKHHKTIAELEETLNKLQVVDIEKELAIHAVLKEVQLLIEEKTRITQALSKERSQLIKANDLETKSKEWEKNKVKVIDDLKKSLAKLEVIDIEEELASHSLIKETVKLMNLEAELKQTLNSQNSQLEQFLKKEKKLLDNLDQIQTNKICYTCGQSIDENHGNLFSEIEENINKVRSDIDQQKNNIFTKELELKDVTGKIVVDYKEPFYETEKEAWLHNSTIENLREKIETETSKENPYDSQITAIRNASLPLVEKYTNEINEINEGLSVFDDIETPFYETEKEAWLHNSTIENLRETLERERNSSNPYVTQITRLKNDSLTKIDPDVIENLQTKRAHQDFLLKILTSKDSFVRKKIIDQTILLLNYRLDHYLVNMGLRHSVKFLNDLSVQIEHMGREYDFDNLSRGQKTRLILSINWAFRDVYETMHGPVNILFIDELLDNGLDGAGVDSSLTILKDMSRTNKKTVYLISHKEEIQPRVDKSMKVVLENEFSSIEGIDVI